MKRGSYTSALRNKTYTDNCGYSRFKGSNIPVHRWAAEKKLGRRLGPTEVVHHKNRNKRDNSFNNLYVFRSQEVHWTAHKKDAQNYGWEYSLTGKRRR